MRGRAFLDTNIFFYLYSADEANKRIKIEHTIANASFYRRYARWAGYRETTHNSKYMQIRRVVED